MPDVLYVPDEGGFESTELTRGPWRADAQHGGPPSALLGRMIESALEPDQVVGRISVELVRPVPIVRLTPSVSTSFVSRRVTHASAELRAGDVVVAVATALLLRTAPMPAPEWSPDEPAELPDEDHISVPPSWRTPEGVPVFHRDAVEHRVVVGGFEERGPAESWMRLRPELIAGEAVSPLVRVLAVTDIASGISSVYDFRAGYGMINADLTVAVTRPLVGEWVHLRTTTRVSSSGTGLCATVVGDERGHVAVATQSLLGVRPPT